MQFLKFWGLLFMIDSYKADYPEINRDNKVILENGLVIYDCTKTDKGIKGFVDDTENQITEKAYYNASKFTWYFGTSNIKRGNLIPLSERNKTERMEIIKNSKIKAKENREKAKSLNDIAKAMLDTKLNDKQIKKLLGVDTLPEFIDSDNTTVGSLLIVRGLESALVDKNFKWAEFVRDTAGYKPKNEVDISADIMTDADRQLMENIQKRLG